MIPSILDRFSVANVDHICLVTKPAGMSLSDARNASLISLFQVRVARAIAAKLMIAVDYVHSRGFVHRDLQRGNIPV